MSSSKGTLSLLKVNLNIYFDYLSLNHMQFSDYIYKVIFSSSLKNLYWGVAAEIIDIHWLILKLQEYIKYIIISKKKCA